MLPSLFSHFLTVFLKQLFYLCVVELERQLTNTINIIAMRKIYLFMLMFCGLFLCGQAAQAQTSYVLSNATYQSSSADGQTYNFKDGFSVSNAKNKAYQYVKETDYVKYSATTYTINIPDGISISKITFEGYNNTKQIRRTLISRRSMARNMMLQRMYSPKRKIISSIRAIPSISRTLRLRTASLSRFPVSSAA